MQRKSRRALYLHLPESIYNNLKLIVERKNITITRFIIRLIVEAIMKEKDLS